MMLQYILLSALFLFPLLSHAQTQIRIDFQDSGTPMEIDRMALGQGGLSEEPMWDNRIAEIRALHPRLIRLFIQEYFDLLPEAGRYHFETLDRSVDTIFKTGAKPVMCICFKPKALFPEINHDIVEPTDYAAWEDLIFNLVRYYKERGAGIEFWEVANEPDIGESGGCPYRFQPDSYVRYYQHTVNAILKADPKAKVGGPALASVRSPIFPALLETCEAQKIPLHFVSWHIYSSSPKQIRETIDFAHSLLKEHPSLKPETMLNEWNVDLGNFPDDPRFQPCYIAEVIGQMKDAGLDYSCYYHIRDYHVSFDRFAQFMSPQGNAFMAKWWNRRPQWDGLFDYQNAIRPAYFTFKLLSRLAGNRLVVESNGDWVHALASWDETFQLYNVLVWNFSSEPVTVQLTLVNMPKDLQAKPIVLDALTPSSDENIRLKSQPAFGVKKDQPTFTADLEPYGVRFWYFEP